MRNQRQLLRPCSAILCFFLAIFQAHGNFRFDPDADGNTLWCTTAPYTDPENYFRPVEGQCADPYFDDDTNSTNSTTTGAGTGSTVLDLSSISPAALQALAVAYAPVVFFHPLERYTLSSVDATFSPPGRGKIYKDNGGAGEKLIDDKLNLTTLLRTSRDPVWALKSSSFFFTLEEYAKEQYYADPTEQFGDGYDESGKSKAKIYYNVFDSGNGTWTFNYWLYYEFNGEGNMGTVTTYDGLGTQYTPFQLKPYGVHEGDFEAISVMVCPPTNELDVFGDDDDLTIPEPLAVSYRQHNWNELLDCTLGECKFYKDTNHPVGFCALNSHATYSDSAMEIVYINVDVGFFYNLQAYVAVDRTMYKKKDGSYNYFMPTYENVEQLQKPEDLTLEATNLQKYFWQGFGGNWGSGKPISLQAEPPLCLDYDQQSFVDCPTREQDPVFDLVMQLMAVREPRTEIIGFVQDVTSKIVDAVAQASAGPTGPVTKFFYEDWVKPINPPLWDFEDPGLQGQEYCASVLDIPDYSTNGIDQKDLDALSQFYMLVSTVLILTILNFLVPFLGLIGRGTGHYKPIRMSEGGPIPLTFFDHMLYSAGALIYTVFLVIMVVAGLIFLHGSNKLVNTLEDFVQDIQWDLLRDVLFAMGCAILVVNTLLMIFLWMQALEMNCMIRLRHAQLSGSRRSEDGGPISWDKKFVPWSPVLVEIFFRFCFAGLFFSMMLSMVCVMLGIGVVGFSAAFVTLCNETVGSLDHLCLNLDFIGIPQVACGDDFQAFCNHWATAATKMVLWSSFLVFVSHFYVIAAAGYASQQRRSIPAILALYPEQAEEDNSDDDSIPTQTKPMLMIANQPMQENGDNTSSIVKASNEPSGLVSSAKEQAGPDSNTIN